jgi:membrane protein
VNERSRARDHLNSEAANATDARASEAGKPQRLAPHDRQQISPWRLGGLSVVELGKRVWHSIEDDDVFGHSAELAYYFTLAVFPSLIFVLALLGMLAGPGSHMRESLIGYMQTAMPGSAFEILNKVLGETASASSGGKLTFGLFAALWTASSGMVALQNTLNAVYNVKEGRPLWKARGIAIGLTIVCSMLLLIALAIVLYGTDLANLAANRAGFGSVITIIWSVVQWVVALGFVSMVFALVYYFAPDVEQRKWYWITPGATIGMATWLIASIALRIYLRFFNSYSATFGSVGAAIILMTWFYVSGMMILIGAEANSAIENAAAKRGEPGAKQKGEKVPYGESRPAA